MRKIFMIMVLAIACATMQAQRIFEKGNRTQGVQAVQKVTSACKLGVEALGQVKTAVAVDSTVDVVCSEIAVPLYYDPSTTDWYVGAFSDDGIYTVKLDFWSKNPDNPNGHYTGVSTTYKENTMCYKYSRMVNRISLAELDSTYFSDCDINVERKSDGECTVSGWVMGKNGVKFNVDIHQAAPLVPKKTVTLNIECDPKNSYLSTSECAFFGQDKTTGMYAQVAVQGMSGAFQGNYVLKDYTLVCKSLDAEGKPVGAVGYAEQQSANVSYDDNHNFDVICTFVGTDTIKYDITMHFTMPEAGETRVVKCTNGEFMSFWGMVSGTGSNDDWEQISMQVSGRNDDGTVPVDKFAGSVYNGDGTTATEGGSSIFVDSARMDYDENQKPIIHAVFLANDYHKYDVDMRFVMPEKKDDKTYTISNTEYTNALKKESAQRIIGYTDDGLYAFTVITYGSEVTGNYSVEGGTMSVQIKNQTLDKTYKAYTGTAVITMSEDSVITFTSDNLFGSDATMYHLTMTTKFQEANLGQYKYDEQTGSAEIEYLASECTDCTYYSDQGFVNFVAKNTMRNDMVRLVFNIAGSETGIVIPVGQYTFNDNDAYGTVQANPGVTDDVLYPSYYAVLGTEAGSFNKIYMLVDGTVDVWRTADNKLAWYMDALNSWRVPVRIWYNCSKEDIKNIMSGSDRLCDSTTKKVLMDGRMLILRNGVAYTVGGVNFKLKK